MYASPIHHALPPKPPVPIVPFDSLHSPPSLSPGAPVNPLSPNASRPPGPLDPFDVVNYCFAVPFSHIPGPNPDDIILETPGAREKWFHPPDAPKDTPPWKLPVHRENSEALKKLCKEISDNPEYDCKAVAIVTEQNPHAFSQKRKGLATSVWLGGEPNCVLNMRSLILKSSNVAMTTACVNIDHEQYYDDNDNVRMKIVDHLLRIAKYTGTDIFVLKMPEPNLDSAIDPGNDGVQARRLKIKIYGDRDSVEYAKTRILIMIDDLLGQQVGVMYMELSLQTLVCGRGRKNVKMVESTTGTAIYFPPPFPRIFGGQPPNSTPRDSDQVLITGSNRADIARAEAMLARLLHAQGARLFCRDVPLSMYKLDYIILDRLDEVRKIMEANGTFVQFPRLGGAQYSVRVQGFETLNVERTIRAIMNIAGQFYIASWWLMGDGGPFRPPTQKDIQQMLFDICAHSGADIAFNKQAFEIWGSDDGVKRALQILNEIKFANSSPFQVRVKIELAIEHREFVSGKKNGKINKIMGQSNIQIIFESFNEYNFVIDVCGTKYDATMLGLQLVEQELPASVAFHVPDSYHKRIIGIGGQHIQRIMKKYSVFVKFSNAMERGAVGKADSDDLKVDNVICRTPARNAANLELVKAEIMNMVQQADADIVTEKVSIPRLLHRSLIAKRDVLDELEHKWGCAIIFPSTEMASDDVTIKGPEWQIPQAIHEFLALVPESHQIRLPRTPELEDLIARRDRWEPEILEPMKNQFGIDMEFNAVKRENNPELQAVTFAYTRNNAGGLRDAIEMLINYLVSQGIRAELVRGGIPRPKSDSFEDFVPFFNSAVLQSAGMNQSQDPHRPGSRLSGDMTSILGEDLHAEPTPLTSDTATAFWNADLKMMPGGVPESYESRISVSPRSHPSSKRNSRAGSFAWEGGNEATNLADGEDWTKVDMPHNRV
ncbi:hypothetical protein RUND412_008638 [Rhizina undulata]